MKYHLIIFGCQFNISDSQRVAGVVQKMGYEKTADINQADLIIVLACSVRQTAIDRIHGLKHRFNRLKKKRPVITVLSGCVLDSDLEKMSETFDLIYKSEDLPKLPELIRKIDKKIKPSGSLGNYFDIHPQYDSTFQAYVPIITGCNNFCAYCVVPYTRGREKSRPAEQILKECRELIRRGYKEITLIGQNVNSYRDKNITFASLLKKVDEISGEYWLSFATSHPKDLSEDLLRVMSKAKHLMPYLHLPVQAGDDEILRAMNRRYTAKHYLALIAKARGAVKNLAVSTDAIVGFPNESVLQFNNTAKLFKKVDYDMAYLAQYSPRAGTKAAMLADNVSIKEKRRREFLLNNILKKSAHKNNQKMVGQVWPVLVHSYKAGYCYGRTKNNKNIKFASSMDYTGKFVRVKVTDCYAWGLSGELPKILVITGTTASGKTKLAVRLARKFKGEIISADSRQVYKGMDIGTGKDLKEYGKIPYHLIDVADPKKVFTVVDWQKMAYEKINEILERGRLPIICGGSGLYVSSLVHGYQFTEATKDQRAELKKLESLTTSQLLQKLKKIDEPTYLIIDKNNRRRIIRALIIYFQTGKSKSEQLAKIKPPYDFLQLGITFEREILKQRIKKRLIDRLEKEGLVAEIKRLHKNGVSYKRLEEFGLEYRYIGRYLQGKIIYDELVLQLNSAIADFAKRQMTWFKKDFTIDWVKDFGEAEKKIKSFLG